MSGIEKKLMQNNLKNPYLSFTKPRHSPNLENFLNPRYGPS